MSPSKAPSLSSSAGRAALWLIAASAALLIGAIAAVQFGAGVDGILDKHGAEATPRTAPSRIQPISETESIVRRPAAAHTLDSAISTGTGSSSPYVENVQEAASLTVLVIDPETEQAVPGIVVTIISERPQRRGFGTAISDAKGRAPFFGLAENLYVAVTHRQPPFAESYGGTWLLDGQQGEITVRLSHGGRAKGVVVDENFKPIQGAKVFAQPSWAVNLAQFSISGNPHDSYEAQAIFTNDKGFYELPALSNQACQFWIANEQLDPREHLDAELLASADGASQLSTLVVKAGADSTVWPIVLPGLRTWVGSVVDQQGNAEPFALVSSNWRRDPGLARINSTSLCTPELAPPGDAKFVALESEARTDSNGNFILQARSARQTVNLRSANGDHARAWLPPLKAGERAEDLELVLPRKTSIEFEIVDGSGQPVLKAHPKVLSQGLDIFTNHLGRESGSWSFPMPSADPWIRGIRGNQVIFKLQSITGSGRQVEWETVECDAQPGGLYRPQFNASIDRARTVLVYANGYRVSSTSEIPSPQVAPIRVTLEALPSLRFEVALSPRWPRTEIHQLTKAIEFVVTSIAPDRAGQMERSSELADNLGSTRFMYLGADGEHAQMFVQEPGTYWAYAFPEDSYRNPSFDKHVAFGPFRTDDSSTHAIIIPNELAEALLHDSSDGEHKAPTEKGTVAVRYRDASTGETIDSLPLTFAGEKGSIRVEARSKKTKEGRSCTFAIESGTWTPSGHWRDHEYYEGSPIVVEPGKTVELGTIDIRPRPRIQGMLLRSDGRTLESQVSLFLREVGTEETWWSTTQSGGEFDMAWGSNPISHAKFVREDTNKSYQYHCLSVGQLQSEFKLTEWRDVEITIHGLSPETHHAAMEIRLDSQACSIADHPNFEQLRLPSRMPQHGGKRAFHATLGVGTYRLSLGSDHYSLATTLIEITPGSSRQKIEFTVY